MTYSGEIKNGMVVLKDAPKLEDGTEVRVEVIPCDAEPQPRTTEAVLQGVAKFSGSWAESAKEMDEALEYIRQSKWEQVRLQQSHREPEL